MDRLRLIISGFSGTAGQFGEIAAQVLQDRLELLDLELREVKIRHIQALLLACTSMAFFLLGILALIVAGLYVLPSRWRVYGLAITALISLVAGTVALIVLRKHLKQNAPAFAQTVTELKKDMACFSIKN